MKPVSVQKVSAVLRKAGIPARHRFLSGMNKGMVLIQVDGIFVETCANALKDSGIVFDRLERTRSTGYDFRCTGIKEPHKEEE